METGLIRTTLHIMETGRMQLVQLAQGILRIRTTLPIMGTGFMQLVQLAQGIQLAQGTLEGGSDLFLKARISFAEYCLKRFV